MWLVDARTLLGQFAFQVITNLCVRMASSSTAKLILVTGPPGVGKTTVVRKVCEKLISKDKRDVAGFYTEDVRQRGQRIGFDVVTLDGKRGELARVSLGLVEWNVTSKQTMKKQADVKSSLIHTSDIPTQTRDFRVGQYSVNLQSFERLVLPLLRSQKDGGICVIDEIGKMELFSDAFKQLVKAVIHKPNLTVLATVPSNRGKPIAFVEDIKRCSTMLFTVTKGNRDALVNEMIAQMIDS